MPAAAVSAALAVDPAAEDKVWPVAAPAAAVSVAALVSVPVSVCPAATPVAAVRVALAVDVAVSVCAVAIPAATVADVRVLPLPPLKTTIGMNLVAMIYLKSCQGFAEIDNTSCFESARFQTYVAKIVEGAGIPLPTVPLSPSIVKSILLAAPNPGALDVYTTPSLYRYNVLLVTTPTFTCSFKSTGAPITFTCTPSAPI